LGACKSRIDQIFSYAFNELDEDGIENLSQHMANCIPCSKGFNDVVFERVKEDIEKEKR